MEKQISKEKHIEQHKELHRSFDELLADFITNTEKRPSNTTVLEFLQWSHSQTISPDDKEV